MAVKESDFITYKAKLIEIAKIGINDFKLNKINLELCNTVEDLEMECLMFENRIKDRMLKEHKDLLGSGETH